MTPVVIQLDNRASKNFKGIFLQLLDFLAQSTNEPGFKICIGVAFVKWIIIKLKVVLKDVCCLGLKDRFVQNQKMFLHPHLSSGRKQSERAP